MATATTSPIAIFLIPTEIWDNIRDHIPSIRDRVSTSLAFRDTKQQTRSKVSNWQPGWAKLAEESDIKANILRSDNLADTFAKHLHIDTDLWRPKNIRPWPSSLILQHHPTLGHLTYTQLRRNQKQHNIDWIILDGSQYQDQAHVKEAVLFPVGQSDPAVSTYSRERGCATFFFDIARKYRYGGETCQSRLCYMGGSQEDKEHQIMLCSLHKSHNIQSLQTSLETLSRFEIRISHDEAQRGAILSWTHPYYVDRAIKALPQAEIDVLVRGIYGKSWTELQQPRFGRGFSPRERQLRGRQYSACIKAVRLVRNWYHRFLENGSQAKDTEVLGGVIPADLAAPFRTATGLNLDAHIAIVELLQYVRKKYLTKPAMADVTYRNKSTYARGLLEDVWADCAAADWIQDGLKKLKWITNLQLLRSSIIVEKSWEPEIITRSYDSPAERSYCTYQEANQLCVAIHRCPLGQLWQQVTPESQRRNLSAYLHLQAAIDELETQVGTGLAEALFNICEVINTPNIRTDFSAFVELQPHRESRQARRWLMESARVLVDWYRNRTLEHYQSGRNDVEPAKSIAEVDTKLFRTLVDNLRRFSRLPSPMGSTNAWISDKYAMIIVDEPPVAKGTQASALWQRKTISQALSGPWREVLDCFEGHIFGIAKGSVNAFVRKMSSELFGNDTIKPFRCGRVLWCEDSQTPAYISRKTAIKVQEARDCCGFPSKRRLGPQEGQAGHQDIEMSDSDSFSVYE